MLMVTLGCTDNEFIMGYMLKIKDLFKKFFLLITSLFLLGSCSYIDAQFNTSDLPLVGGLFLSKNDPVNIDIV